MNRFSKDIDTIDNMLAGSTSFTGPGRVIRSDLTFADSFRMFLNTTSTTIGAIVLISILLPWFLIAVGIVSVLYAMAAAFYRASARETKVRASKILDFDVFTERCFSGSTLSCGRRCTPISLSPCQGLQPFELTGKKVDS